MSQRSPTCLAKASRIRSTMFASSPAHRRIALEPAASHDGRGASSRSVATNYKVRIAPFARLQRIRVMGKPTEVTANPMAKQMMVAVSSGVSLPRSIATSALCVNMKANASQSASCITVYQSELANGGDASRGCANRGQYSLMVATTTRSHANPTTAMS